MIKVILSNKYVRLVLILSVSFTAGYLYCLAKRDTKIITVEKEKVVVKYLKAKRIEIKPDGTTIATGGVSLDSNEQETTDSHTIINPHYTVVMFGTKINLDGIAGYDGRVQHDIIDNFGVYAGAEYFTRTKSFYFPVGVSLKF